MPGDLVAIFARFASQDSDGFGLKLLAALRNEFGAIRLKSGL